MSETITPKDVDAILETLSESSVSEITITKGNSAIHLIRDVNTSSDKNAQKVMTKTLETNSSTTNNLEILLEDIETKENYNDVLSPEVGVFVRSKDSESPLLVKLRDEIKEGDVIAFIHATGIIYEVKSNYSGKVVEILVEDGQAVEYAQPLFRLK